jgi:AcrR family transcriptional regulator
MAVGQVNANDPRVKRTRKLLEQALMELMREKSFDAITVQDLAERSTLNRATFYAHFEDKYDLLDSIMRDGVQQALAGAVPATAPFDAGTLLVLCRTVFDFLAQLQDHCRPRDRQFDPLLERAVQDVLQGFVAGWLQQGPGAGAVGAAGVETAAAVIAWAIFGTASQWSRGPRHQPAEVVAAQVVAVLTEGLAVPAAVR